MLTFNVRGGAPPPNDDFDNARVVPGIPFTDTKSTEFATVEAEEPQSPCSHHGVSTIWYSLTPTEDMLIVAETKGIDFITLLSAWTTGPDGLIDLGCRHAYAGRTASFAIQAVAGQTYYFVVDSFGSRTASFTITVSCP